ncbi:copper homeostasis protein CutC [Pasteurella sp. PK-2025]|uniref:copper homeostasis protein CutC n=1 Tax=unclassified Pasteurella TaxID=2621516 RepID=UPI003C736D19
MKLEVCIDNIESAMIAEQAGADRLELCACLSVGGVTPSYGLIESAVDLVNIPCYVMIRPRAGDFLFNTLEIDMMVKDIQIAKQLGAQGVVIGALTSNAEIDCQTSQLLIQAAEGLDVTFHRAFDLCKDPFKSLEQLIELGCDRVLTSGQHRTALEGKIPLKRFVEQAKQRIQIMAGAGICAENLQTLIDDTGVNEVHLSGKGYRLSTMPLLTNAIMGNCREEDQKIWRTDFEKIQHVRQILDDYREK